jgi:hypothetical protein
MMWSLRSAYHEASKVMNAQDAFCTQVEAGLWNSESTVFPDDIQWEMLVDVLRGKVKVCSCELDSPPDIDLVELGY